MSPRGKQTGKKGHFIGALIGAGTAIASGIAGSQRAKKDEAEWDAEEDANTLEQGLAYRNQQEQQDVMHSRNILSSYNPQGDAQMYAKQGASIYYQGGGLVPPAQYDDLNGRGYQQGGDLYYQGGGKLTAKERIKQNKQRGDYKGKGGSQRKNLDEQYLKRWGKTVDEYKTDQGRIREERDAKSKARDETAVINRQKIKDQNQIKWDEDARKRKLELRSERIAKDEQIEDERVNKLAVQDKIKKDRDALAAANKKENDYYVANPNAKPPEPNQQSSKKDIERWNNWHMKNTIAVSSP